MQHRPRGAILAAAGLLALVVVLLATPDAAAWVLGAWVLVLAGVAAVALGIALGFRHQAHLEAPPAPPQHYLTADWIEGAQLFTVGARAEPQPPEPSPEPASVPTPDLTPAAAPSKQEPELEPTAGRQWSRYPRVAAALVVANAVRELIKPGRAAQ